MLGLLLPPPLSRDAWRAGGGARLAVGEEVEHGRGVGDHWDGAHVAHVPVLEQLHVLAQPVHEPAPDQKEQERDRLMRKILMRVMNRVTSMSFTHWMGVVAERKRREEGWRYETREAACCVSRPEPD